MGIPDHLTCLLRNLYAGQEATVRTGHGTTNWFPVGKGVHQGCILSPCFFNFYAEYIMRNAGLHPCCCRWHYFFLVVEYYSIVYVIHSKRMCISYHSSVDKHLGCFPYLGYCKQCCSEHWSSCLI